MIRKMLRIYLGYDNYDKFIYNEYTYKNNHFSLTTFSLLNDYLMLYNRENIVIEKITVDIGIPIIFLKGLTNVKSNFNILLPLNTYYIKSQPENDIVAYKEQICNNSLKTIKLINIYLLTYEHFDIPQTQIKIANDYLKTITDKSPIIYLNEQHKEICKYYSKYLELVEIVKKHPLKTITYNILYHTINYNKIKINKKELKLTLYYNDYNKKFINQIYDNIDINYIKTFIDKNNNFLKKLSIEELNTLRYYTKYGDTIINKFLNGLFDVEWFKTTYSNKTQNEPFINVDDKDSRIFLFQTQIYNYYKTKKIEKDDLYKIKNKKNNEKKNNWKYSSLVTKTNPEIFDMYFRISNKDYMNIFKLYVIDLQKIFNKAPKLEQKLIVYRGVKTIYHIKLKNKENIFINPFFSSTTLLFDIANNFSGKNGFIQKITIDIGMPVIFMEGITFIDNKEFEVLLPFNTYYVIEQPFIKKINLFKSMFENDVHKNTICNISNTIVKITDIHLIGYTKNIKILNKIIQKYGYFDSISTDKDIPENDNYQEEYNEDDLYQ